MNKALFATILLLVRLLMINAFPASKRIINDNLTKEQNHNQDIHTVNNEIESTPEEFRPFAEVLDLLDRLRELQSEINAAPHQEANGNRHEDGIRLFETENQQHDSRDEAIAHREKLEVQDFKLHGSQYGTVSRREKRETQSLDLSQICKTAECLQKLVEYLKWRQENGYPDYTGVWKVGK